MRPGVRVTLHVRDVVQGEILTLLQTHRSNALLPVAENYCQVSGSWRGVGKRWGQPIRHP